MPSSRPHSPTPPAKAAENEPPPEKIVKKKQQDPRQLLNVVKNLIRTRHGSVLTRNTILKMDHFEKGNKPKIEANRLLSLT